MNASPATELGIRVHRELESQLTGAEKPEIPTIGPNRELQRLSVSTFQGFDRCERYLFFDKVLHEFKPERSFLNVGTQVHEQNEVYVDTGQMVLGEIALAGKHLIPAPRTSPTDRSLLLEYDFGLGLAPGDTRLEAAGVPFSGYIDVVNLRRIDERLIRVTDYKTSKDFSAVYDGKPALSRPEDLVTTSTPHGVQMIGYSKWAFGYARQRYGIELARVELEHIYFQTKGRRRAEVVLAEVTRTQADEEWGRGVEARIPRMREVAKADSIADLKPAAGKFPGAACKAYGGCPFYANCLHHQSTKGVPKMGLLDRLRNAPAAATPPPTAPVDSTAKPAPAAEVARVVEAAQQGHAVITTIAAAQEAQKVLAAKPPEGFIFAKNAIQGRTYAMPSDGAAGVFLCSVEGGLLSFDRRGAIEKLSPETPIREVAAVLPPDAPKSDPVKAAEVPSAAALASAPPEVQTRAAELEAAQKAAQPAPTASPEASAEAPKRKRRTKAEMEADAAKELTVDKGPEYSQAAPEADPVNYDHLTDILHAGSIKVSGKWLRSALGEEAGTSASPLRVYVNAIPSGGVFRDLRTYIAEKKASIEKGFEVEDLRLAPKKDTNGRDHALAFGGWKAVLEKVVRAEPPAPATWVLIGDTSEVAQVAVEALAGVVAPENFIRGVR